MIGAARGVLLDPAAELRVRQHRDPVRTRWIYARIERLDRRVQVGQEVAVPAGLVVVGVEAAVDDADDPHAEVGVDDVGGHDELSLQAARLGRHVRVHRADRPGRGDGAGPECSECVAVRAEARGHVHRVDGRVDACFRGVGGTRSEDIACGVGQDEPGGGVAAQVQRQLAERHRLDLVAYEVGLAERIEPSSEPAVAGCHHCGPGHPGAEGPLIARAEVTQVRRGVADALDDCDLAGIESPLQIHEARMEPEPAGQRERLCGRDTDRRTIRVVRRLPVRHDHVQAVVASSHVEHYEHALVARRRRDAQGPAQRSELAGHQLTGGDARK